MEVVRVSEAVFPRIRDHAEKACIGGKSHVRTADRQSALSVDQLVGQLGQYGFSTWYGDAEAYFRRREEQDLAPFLGDGGSDHDGLDVDVKTSMMRYAKDPTRYNLPVRPRERHDNWKYVAAFVATLTPPLDVYLMGWIPDSLLGEPAASGTFEGAYVVPVNQLLPMRVLKTNL